MKKYKSIFIVILIYIIDLISKLIVSNNMKLYESKEIIKNFFYLTFTKNKGAAFGILSSNTILIVGISLLVLIYLIYEIFKKDNNNISSIGMSFILGGLLSNLSDRLFLGYVRDFLDFKIFNFDFAIFNVGDIFIVCGCFLFIISEIMEVINAHKRRRKGN